MSSAATDADAPSSHMVDPQCPHVKRYVAVAIVIVICVGGWQLYDHFRGDLGDRESTDRATPSEREIHELTQKLYADEQQYNPYLGEVNFQSRTKASSRDDRAPQPLLQVHEEQLAGDGSYTKTISLMKRLFDNYHLDTLAPEQITAEQQQEQLDFLRALLQTAPMQRTMRFLAHKGAVTDNYEAQLRLLQDLWFTQYSRGDGRVGSSGFEHVFLAELKQQTILGLHNWIYFGEQERQGHLDYKGYIERLPLGHKDQHLAAVRFTFHDLTKPYNTLFIGTSPELEMSLYTLCFLLRSGQPCSVRLGEAKFKIVTHAWDWHGRKVIATAYPSIGS